MTTLDELSVKITADSSNFDTGVNRAQSSVAGFSSKVATASQNLTRFGQTGFQAMAVMDRFQLSNISVENAMTGLANAQIRYNQTLADFGKDSQQAILAQNQLDQAARQVESANTQAKLSFATMGISMIGMVPQIISFGTTAVASFTAATASVVAFKAAVLVAAPYIAIIGAAIGGLYYLWDRNQKSVKANTDELTKYQGVLRQTKTGLTDVRAEIEKPVATPSLMDVFQSVVYQDREGNQKRRTGAEISAYNTPGGQNSRMLSSEMVNLMGLNPAAAVPAQVAAPGYTISNTREADFAELVRQAKANKPDPQAAFEAAMGKYPRTVNVYATINSNDNPFKVGENVGRGIAQGVDYSKFKFAGQ